jgi:hypothetical protein
VALKQGIKYMEQLKSSRTHLPNQSLAQSKNGRAALVYAERYSFSVFPCVERGKNPLTPNGFKGATKERGMIQAYWSQHPKANVAIACGGASGGLFVIDVDGAEGRESLQKIEAVYGRLPLTPMVLTGKGYQLYFKTKNELGCRVKVAPGIDLRGTGGYVVAPPSIHPNGKEYQWAPSRRHDEVEIAILPDWFAKLIERKNDSGLVGKDWPSILAQRIPEGARNQTIASILGYLLHKRVNPILARQLIHGFNLFRLEKPLPEKEIEKTFHSIAKAESAKRGGSSQC